MLKLFAIYIEALAGKILA